MQAMIPSPDLVALSWDPAWSETLALAVGRIGRRAEGRPGSIAARELRTYLVALARPEDDDVHRHRLAIAAHGVAELTAASRRTADGAVRAIADSCVQAWRELADRGQLALGAHLAEALQALPPNGRVLNSLVDDLVGSRQRRLGARAALVRFGAKAAPATRRLVTWLDRGTGYSVEVREAVLDVLAAAGPSAHEASGALRELVAGRRHPVITPAAARALIAVVPERETLLAAWLDEVSRPDATGARAAQMLVDVGTEARAAASTLAARLTEIPDDSIGVVVRAIEQLGPDAAPAIEPLLILLQRGRRDVAVAAVRALGSIGPAAAPAVPLLLGADDPADPSLQEELVRALEGIGQTGDPSVADWLLGLLTFTPEHRRRVSVAAARALCLSPSSRPAALSVLLWHLRSGISNVETDVVTSLRAIGPAGAAVVPELVAMLDDERLRSPAIQALGALGPTAHAAAGPLARRLRQASATEAPALLAALTRIGAATVVRSAASRLLRSPTSAVRVAAAAALTATGGPDQEDAGDVVRLLDGSPPPPERQALARALAAAEEHGLRLIGSPSHPGGVAVIRAQTLAERAARAATPRRSAHRTTAQPTAAEVWSAVDRGAWAPEWSGTIELLAGRLAARDATLVGGPEHHVVLTRHLADPQRVDDLFGHRLLLAAGAIAETRLGDAGTTPLARRVLDELTAARLHHQRLGHVALAARLEASIDVLTRHDRAGPGSRLRRSLQPAVEKDLALRCARDDVGIEDDEEIAVPVERLLIRLDDGRESVRRDAAAALVTSMAAGTRVFRWAAAGHRTLGDVGPVLVTSVAALARRGAQGTTPPHP